MTYASKLLGQLIFNIFNKNNQSKIAFIQKKRKALLV